MLRKLVKIVKNNDGKILPQIVGYGYNGEENYIDDVHAPFPAIRFDVTLYSLTMMT
jgi:hypothetical protein